MSFLPKHFEPATSATLKDGTPYYLGYFQPAAAPLCHEFHQSAVKAQADGQAFILDKPLGFFQRHLQGVNNGSAILGAFHPDDGRIMGQAVIAAPCNSYPSAGMTDMDHPALDSPKSLSVLQAVSVSPDYRGHGIMHRLTSIWKAHAMHMARPVLLAEIAAGNPASWGTFLDAGLSIVSMGQDPDDGTMLYNAHQNLADINGRKGANIPVSWDDHAAQTELFDEGYTATAWDKDEKTILFSM